VAIGSKYSVIAHPRTRLLPPSDATLARRACPPPSPHLAGVPQAAPPLPISSRLPPPVPAWNPGTTAAPVEVGCLRGRPSMVAGRWGCAVTLLLLLPRLDLSEHLLRHSGDRLPCPSAFPRPSELIRQVLLLTSYLTFSLSQSLLVDFVSGNSIKG
jgi:hypothetical protein